VRVAIGNQHTLGQANERPSLARPLRVEIRQTVYTASALSFGVRPSRFYGEQPPTPSSQPPAFWCLSGDVNRSKCPDVSARSERGCAGLRARRAHEVTLAPRRPGHSSSRLVES
jgi:hypothetical protein